DPPVAERRPVLRRPARLADTRMDRPVLDGAARRGAVSAAPAKRRCPSLVIIGDGWFPDAPGGLNRVVRELHGALQGETNIRTLVLGPVQAPRDGVRVAADRGDSLLGRVTRMAAAARTMAVEAELLEAHFALYALLPVLERSLRGLPTVVHFHGPWAEESRLA